MTERRVRVLELILQLTIRSRNRGRLRALPDHRTESVKSQNPTEPGTFESRCADFAYGGPPWLPISQECASTPLLDYASVELQQGRVLLDADTNELTAIADRRLRAFAFC